MWEENKSETVVLSLRSVLSELLQSECPSSCGISCLFESSVYFSSLFWRRAACPSLITTPVHVLITAVLWTTVIPSLLSPKHRHIYGCIFSGFPHVCSDASTCVSPWPSVCLSSLFISMHHVTSSTPSLCSITCSTMLCGSALSSLSSLICGGPARGPVWPGPAAEQFKEQLPTSAEFASRRAAKTYGAFH